MDNIIARIRDGDNQALEDIYLEYREPFIAWSLKNYNGSRDHAVEFYQMAILILYDNIMLGKLSQLSGSVKSYLLPLAKINGWNTFGSGRDLVTPSRWSFHICWSVMMEILVMTTGCHLSGRVEFLGGERERTT
ncbi:MAG: hypothetical protein IPL46_01785 [Saprospiraceae bacterium]|nr:hypothetical protein [Saprospiraceae bacterium]